jgi:hypothetical protein
MAVAAVAGLEVGKAPVQDRVPVRAQVPAWGAGVVW